MHPITKSSTRFDCQLFVLFGYCSFKRSIPVTKLTVLFITKLFLFRKFLSTHLEDVVSTCIVNGDWIQRNGLAACRDLITGHLWCECRVVFACFFFFQVWHNLQQTGFLPRCVSAKISEDDKTKVEWVTCRSCCSQYWPGFIWKIKKVV